MKKYVVPKQEIIRLFRNLRVMLHIFAREELDNCIRISLRYRNRVYSFEVEIYIKTVAFVSQNFYFLCVDNVSPVASHERSVSEGFFNCLYLASNHITIQQSVFRIISYCVVIFCLDVIQVIEFDGEFQNSFIVGNIYDVNIKTKCKNENNFILKKALNL